MHTPRRSARRRRKTPLGMRTRTASNERMRSGRPAKSARNTHRLGVSTHRCDARRYEGHGGRESVERARGAGHNLGVIHINSRALCSMVLYPVSIPARLVEKSVTLGAPRKPRWTSTTEVLVLPLCGRESEPVQNKRVSRRQGKTIQTRKGRPTTSSISTSPQGCLQMWPSLRSSNVFREGDKVLRNTWRRGLGSLRSTQKIAFSSPRPLANLVRVSALPAGGSVSFPSSMTTALLCAKKRSG